MIIPDEIAEFLGDRKHGYIERVERDYEVISPWLPDYAHKTLDIGCGLGGINIFTAAVLGTTYVTLIDGDGSAPRKMGFVEGTQAWSDVRMAIKLISANLKKNQKAQKFTPGGIYIDLITSLKSWGHHYPVDEYLKITRRWRGHKCRLIIDIRNGTDGREKLERDGWQFVDVCYETVKAKRMVFAGPS